MTSNSINNIFRNLYVGKLFLHSEDSIFVKQDENHYNLTSLEKNNFSIRSEYVSIKKGEISLLTNILNKENTNYFIKSENEIILELFLLVASKKCVVKYPLLISTKKDMSEIINFSFNNCRINLLEETFKDEL